MDANSCLERLRCPITHELFLDPVVAADNQVYERQAITRWLTTSNNSPMTGVRMSNKQFIKVEAVKSMVDCFIDINPEMEEQRYTLMPTPPTQSPSLINRTMQQAREGYRTRRNSNITASQATVMLPPTSVGPIIGIASANASRILNQSMNTIREGYVRLGVSTESVPRPRPSRPPRQRPRQATPQEIATQETLDVFHIAHERSRELEREARVVEERAERNRGAERERIRSSQRATADRIRSLEERNRIATEQTRILSSSRATSERILTRSQERIGEIMARHNSANRSQSQMPFETFNESMTRANIQQCKDAGNNLLIDTSMKFRPRNDIMKFLIDSNINVISNTKFKFVHYVLKFGSPENILHFLPKISDKEQRDNHGMRPLHYTCTYSTPEIIKRFIDLGCNIESKNKKGWRAIHFASAYSTLDVVKALERKGVILTTKTNGGITPLHLLCSAGKIDIVRHIADKVNLNVENDAGRRAIDMISMHATPALIEFFADRDIHRR